MAGPPIASAWTPVEAPPGLAAGAVHVWRMRIDRPEVAAWDLLAADERARAERFHFAHDRERFVAARAGLRRILGRYLDCPAGAIAFRLGSHGKPALDGDAPRLSFNLSHSGDLALLAITRRGALGVDVEREQPALDVEGMAARWFSATERRALLALPAEARAAAFFRCWTRKESYIKAHGEGLSLPLDRFTVSLDEATAVTFACDDPAEQGRWWLCALPIDAGYAAALTVEGAPDRVDLHDVS